MRYRYAFKSGKENIVKAVGRDIEVSTKQAIEICSFIKNKSLEKARAILKKAEDKQLAIPFKRFTQGAGHKKGMASGKYPVNASKQFLKLLKALEANAQNKGLSSELRIIHACAQKASRPFHYGRKRRIMMKRTHVELVAEEAEHVKREAKKEVKKKTKKEEKKAPPEESKEEVKKEEKSEEKKEEPKKEEIKEVKKEKETKKEIKQGKNYSSVAKATKKPEVKKK